MSDDEILDAFHEAFLAHNANKARPDVTDESYCETYDAAASAEKAMFDHFGPAEGWKRYRGKYPNSN